MLTWVSSSFIITTLVYCLGSGISDKVGDLYWMGLGIYEDL